jgi:hypothetical protein
MAGNDAAQKLFEAMNESSDALIDAIRAANDRGHRFSAALIEQAQESQREAAEFARKWASAPFDVSGLFSSLVESTTKAQGRAVEGARQWFSEIGDVQKETREIAQRVIDANRKVNEAGVEMARGMFTRAGEAVQSITDGNGRTASRETPRETASNAPQPSSGI